MTSRLNARIDAPLAKKVAALRRTTRQTTTDVVRTAIERYYDAVEREARPYDMLVASGFVGCAEGPADLSVNYEAALTESLEAKMRATGRSAKARPARKRASKR